MPAEPVGVAASAPDTGPLAAHPADDVPWHAVEVDDVLLRLRSREAGLEADEVRERLERFGRNAVGRASGTGALRVLWRQIDSPLIWVLVGASLLSLLLGKLTDSLVVLAVVVVNTIIGFVQEHRAGRAIEALSAMVPERIAVRRAGRLATVDATEVVPGDVVTLASGDRVPADVRLLAVKGLHIDESALTGESVPVSKRIAPVDAAAAIGDRAPMAYGGTLVTSGTGVGAVVATGARTELGRISRLLREAVELETPLTRALREVGKQITVAVVILAAAMMAVGIARATAHGTGLLEATRESLFFAIALAVGAIPEGLPAIVTIALAIGVQRMARRRAIVRKLPAVETLGSTTVICSDKTGTLTRNEMAVVRTWLPRADYEITGTGYEPAGELLRDGVLVATPPDDVRELLERAALCSDASLAREGDRWHASGDPTEIAIVVAAERVGIRSEALRRSRPRLDAVPFESERQFMATLHEDRHEPGECEAILKGAPEAVLDRCAGGLQDRRRILAEAERLAADGLRVLAVAAKRHPAQTIDADDVNGGFRVLGLLGLIDPPRPEAIEAIRACRSAGIAVKMITGDHAATARAIGRQLGLAGDGPAVTGNDLAALDDDELAAVARACGVFARVAPEHKLRLVRALQREGHVVAMTGDGVNDAPALRQANIGVAMGITGTAVAKEAADVVLSDDNFASIRAAVEEGRRIYDNLVKSLAFVLPTNLGLALILGFAVAFFPFSSDGTLLMPIEPIQILWINLVATVALALPLAFERPEPDLMQRPPRDPDEPVLGRFVVVRTVLAATLMAAGAIGLFLWEYLGELAAGVPGDAARREAQTMAVTAVVLFQAFYLLSCRSLRGSLAEMQLFGNRVVIAGLVALLALQTLLVYAPPMNALFDTAPIGMDDLALAAVVASLMLPVIGLEKRIWKRAQP